MGEAVEASYDKDGRLYLTFEDATGLLSAEGGVTEPEGPYPAMLNLDLSTAAGSFLPDDARALGLALIRLAEDADRLNAKHFAEAPDA